MRRAFFHSQAVAAALALAAMVMAPAAATADLDEAGQSAVFLIGDSLQVQRDGRHNRLLRALRYLEDPAAEPLLAYLANASQPSLRIHGILGLGELDPGRQVDLKRVAQVAEPAVQAELITAAMGSDLLSTADARQLLAWPGLELSVKVLIATQLVQAGELRDAAPLHEALQSDALGRRALAALLLHQLGDAAGTAELQALNASADPQRDVVRTMLLQTVLRHELDRCANWAYAVATEPGVDEKLVVTAMRAALRFAEPRTVALWRQRFKSSSDPADRTRLALLALRSSPWLETAPGVFEDLTASGDPLLSRMGSTGQAVAAGDPRLTEQAINLLLMHHPLVNEWALDYAREMARPEDAQLILLGIIRSYEQGSRRTRLERLNGVVDASQTLHERYPAIAVKLLRPIVSSAQTSTMLTQGILLGLVRCKGDAYPVIAGLPAFTDIDTRSLALLLLAKSPQPMNDDQLRDLALLVRGGGNLEDSLRIQAAWVYLKRTGQLNSALARLLER